MKITRFATDEKKEAEGVWVEVGDGLSLLIARTNNPAYQAMLKRLLRPYQKQVRLGTMPEDRLDEIFVQVYAHTVLLGWKGLQDEDGRDVKYSAELAIKYLGDSRLKEFRGLVETLASEAELYREQELQEDAETLGNGSGGTSSGARTSKHSPAPKEG